MLKIRWSTRFVALAVTLLASSSVPALAQGTLFVQNNRVGIGTDTPQSPLHIFQSVGEPNLRMETADTAGVRFELVNSAGEWQFIAGPGGNFNFNRVGVAGNQFVFTTSGNLIIQGTLSQGSSKATKKDFQPIDGRQVLAQVAELPLSEWSYKNEDVRHLGPMAEDFGTTFGLGGDSAHLAPGDVAGVALAAIQGLNIDLQEKEARIESLENQIEELRALVAQLARQQPK